MLYEQHVRLTHADETASCNSPQTKPTTIKFRDVYSSFDTQNIFPLRVLYRVFFPTWPVPQSVFPFSERYSHCSRDLSLSPRVQAFWDVQQCLWVSVNRRFGGSQCLHIQGLGNTQTAQVLNFPATLTHAKQGSYTLALSQYDPYLYSIMKDNPASCTGLTVYCIWLAFVNGDKVKAFVLHWYDMIYIY
jgi:hypothetical protein